MPPVHFRAAVFNALTLSFSLVYNAYYNPTITRDSLFVATPTLDLVSVSEVLEEPLKLFFNTLYSQLPPILVKREAIAYFWLPVILFTVMNLVFIAQAIHGLISRHFKINWKYLAYEFSATLISELDWIEFLIKKNFPALIPVYEALSFAFVGVIQLFLFQTICAYFRDLNFRNLPLVKKLFVVNSQNNLDEELGLPFSANIHGLPKTIATTCMINTKTIYSEFSVSHITINMDPTSDPTPTLTSSYSIENSKKTRNSRSKSKVSTITSNKFSSSNLLKKKYLDHSQYLPPTAVSYRFIPREISGIVETADEDPSINCPGAWVRSRQDNLVEEAEKLLDYFEPVTREALFEYLGDDYSTTLKEIAWIASQTFSSVGRIFRTKVEAAVIRPINGLPTNLLKDTGHTEIAPKDPEQYGLRSKRKIGVIPEDLAFLEYRDSRGSEFFRSVKARIDEPRHALEISHHACQIDLIARDIDYLDEADKILRASRNVTVKRFSRADRLNRDAEDKIMKSAPGYHQYW